MFIVVPSTVEHIDDIHEIEQSSFARPWSKRSLEELIVDKHSICLSAVCDGGKTVGSASMMHVVNEGHIYNVVVAHEYRNRQIGTMLVEGLINEALAREMIGLTLEVRVTNLLALRLYKKFGFKRAGVISGYYQHPTEDGLIMWKYL